MSLDHELLEAVALPLPIIQLQAEDYCRLHGRTTMDSHEIDLYRYVLLPQHTLLLVDAVRRDLST